MPVRAEPAELPEDLAALQLGFQCRHWAVRSFAAIESQRHLNLTTLRILLERLDNEPQPRARQFVMRAIADFNRDDWMLVMTEARLDQALSWAMDPVPFAQRTADQIFRTICETAKPQTPRYWVDFWKRNRGGFLQQRADLLKTRGLTDADVAPLPLPPPRALQPGETEEARDDEQMKSFVPDGFGDYLRRMELYGIYQCVLLDDTGSMGDVINEARQRVWDIMGILGEITPKYHLAFVTYKDAVNQTLPFSSDPDTVYKFLKGVSAAGGADDLEGPDKALDHALHNDAFSWQTRAVQSVILMGDQPPHKGDEQRMLDMAAEARERGIVVNAIGTRRTKGGRAEETPFFSEVAEAGGGIYVRLDEYQQLLEEMVFASFGPEYQDFVRPFAQQMLQWRAEENKKGKK